MGYSGFKRSPAPLIMNYLKKVLPLTTQCVCIDLIVVIACDCVVCTCNDSVGVLGGVASG